MKKNLRRVRHILCTFSGEDDVIIKECGINIQKSFANIGFLVIIIFIGCFISASAFMSELFQRSSQWVSIPIGVIWAALITNIYLLLLYTISPTLLPVAKKKRGKGKVQRVIAEEGPIKLQKTVIRISLVLRLVFISALAFIIAQPLNILLLSGSISDKLEDYKSEYRVEMLILSDSSLIDQELNNKLEFLQSIRLRTSHIDSTSISRNIQLIDDKVNSDVIFLESSRKMLEILTSDTEFTDEYQDSIREELGFLVSKEVSSDSQFLSSIDKIVFESTSVNTEMNEYRNNLKKIISAKVANHTKLDSLLNQSNFYIQKIKFILLHTTSGWIISLIVIGCFLFPIYKKYHIRNKGEFYPKKSSLEHDRVISNYNDFKETYSELFKARIDKYNQKLEDRVLKQIHLLTKNSESHQSSFFNEVNLIKFNQEVMKFEYWADPPFRTIRKVTKQQYIAEDKLIQQLYEEEE